MLERAGGLPDAAFACVGGGSNAIGLFHGFLADRGVALFGVEAGGRGPKLGDHSATLTHGKPGVLHGTHTMLLYDAARPDPGDALGLRGPRLSGRRARARVAASRSAASSTSPRATTRRARGARGVLRGRGHPARARELARARGREALGRARTEARRVAGRALGPRRQGHADPRAVPAEELDRGAHDMQPRDRHPRRARARPRRHAASRRRSSHTSRRVIPSRASS